MLTRSGVEEIECGWLGQEVSGEPLADFLLWARAHLPSPRSGGPALALWCPCREADVREAAALFRQGLIHRLSIGAPSSAAHRQKRLGLSQAEMLARVRTVVGTAKAEGLSYISVGLEDISRAEPEEALQLAQAAVAAGACRVRLSDTVGLLTPLSTALLVERFVSELSVPVAFHGHNDLGMATANAVTALQSGAAFVDVSVLGLGERAGIAALEEVAAWATLRCEAGARYDLGVLRELCQLASLAARVPVARNKAVTGEDVFSAESGIHVHGLMRDPALFEPFAPEAVGATRRVGVGAKSGQAALGATLQRLRQLCPGPDTACGSDAGLMDRVRSLAWRLGRPLTDSEILGVL
jgi:homocitrate synthase NifV